MKRLFIFALTVMSVVACQKAEVLSESFMDDALNGVVCIHDTSGADGALSGKYSKYCDLLFYDDGTCRQCYDSQPGGGSTPIADKLRYHTFEWKLDASKKRITLTDNKLLATSPETAVGVLTIKKYKNRKFELVGTLPSPDGRNFKSEEHQGMIYDEQKRIWCEQRYVNEEDIIE